jgi:hypothetical protein
MENGYVMYVIKVSLWVTDGIVVNVNMIVVHHAGKIKIYVLVQRRSGLAYNA